MRLKFNNEQWLDLLAIVLLFMTPVILLFQIHGYPVTSKIFFVFLGLVLIGGFFLLFLVDYLRSIPYFAQVVRCIPLVIGSAYLIMRLSETINFMPAIGIATVFVFLLRGKINRILIITTVSIIVSSVFFLEKLQPIQMINKTMLPVNSLMANQSKKPIFHLIFDEAMGDIGFSKSDPLAQTAKQALLSVLERHGFSTMKNAYTHAQLTIHSLGHMVNLEKLYNLKSVDSENYHVDVSRFFEIIKNNGYNINVYQSSYIDYCSHLKSLIDSCYSYPKHSLSYFKPKEFSQLQLIVPYTLQLLELGDHLNWTAKYTGLRFPNIPTVGALSERVIRKKILQDSEKFKAMDNQYYFAHFLYPHYSHIQDANCNVKPKIEQWTDVGKFKFTHSDSDELRISTEKRDKLYINYYQQFICFSKTVDRFLSEINQLYPDAIIIIHGDHSSRLSTRYIYDHEIENFKFLDEQNYRDLYPVLLSVKHPGNQVGIQDCSISLLEFMQQVFLLEAKPKSQISTLINETLFKGNDSCISYAKLLSQSMQISTEIETGL